MALNSKTRKLAVTGMLSAILIILGTTPLGFIPIGPAKATTMYLPIIIGAVIEGPIVGLVLGLVFGLFSLFQAFTAPSLLSPIFINDWFFVTILPRLLIGPVAYYVFTGAEKLLKNKLPISAGIAAAVGALTNTVGVLGMIFLRNGPKFSELMNMELSAVGAAVLGIALTNGIPEALLSVVVTVPAILAIRRLKFTRKGVTKK